MTPRARRIRAGIAGILLVGLPSAVAPAQTGNVPLSPGSWIATDSLRFMSYLGRPALYINRGVALVRGASMENGTLELDVAASDTTNFLGVVFRAAAPRFSNVLFLRPGASGTEEAVQYGPAFNSLGVAWQVYHGDGARGIPDLRHTARYDSAGADRRRARWSAADRTPRTTRHAPPCGS